MIGSNSIIINQATMTAAIQEWLDKRYSEGVDPGPKVSHVTPYISDATKFLISLEGRQSP